MTEIIFVTQTELDALEAEVEQIITDYDAGEVPFTPTADITSENVQDAIEEVYTDLSGAIAALTAADIAFTPAAGVAATDTQAAIEEVAGDVTALAGRVTTAENDITTIEGDITSLENALNNLTAADVAFTPAGGISTSNVQDALEELDDEKAPKANPAFVGSSSFSGQFPLTIYYQSAGATGPTTLHQHDSSSPADNDVINRDTYQGRNSAAENTNYAIQDIMATDVTDGTEDGAFRWYTMIAGTSAARFQLGAGFFAVGVTGGDKGAGSGNFTGLYDNGNRVITQVNLQVFTASGTYTPTTGMQYCEVICVGGGGGGGGVANSSAGNSTGAGGGGSGGFSMSTLSAADVGASKVVTVGAAGSGGTSGGGTGGAGGSTSLGSLVIANGGSGGPGANDGNGRAGGAGATAGTGDVALTGATGGRGSGGVNITFQLIGGRGAASVFGSGGSESGGHAGIASNVVGAGGGGAYSIGGNGAFAGGAGGSGLCIVREFIA